MRDSLRILMTNHALAARGGTELYLRDLAASLLKRGHIPIVYSTQLGEAAQELRAMTIPVIDNLDALAAPPDLIHGQHNIETMTALLHFPQAPAIFFCHGWLPWQEVPPRFPRILRYVAVDHTCRDKLIYEHAIPEDRVSIIFNFVDLQRFPVRGSLPARPRRALIFSNGMRESTHRIVREACAHAGIELDAIGIGAGHACAQPEKVLGQYDLVFAKARCALEALAVGTAVVLCDVAGIGPMVTTGELERLRQLNFGIRTLRDEIHPEVLAREIARYDAEDAAEVSRRIRATAGLVSAVDEIVALYRAVLAEHAGSETAGAEAENHAAAAYLRWLTKSMMNEQQAILGKMEKADNSTTSRLRDSVLRIPLIGPFARSIARKAARLSNSEIVNRE